MLVGKISIPRVNEKSVCRLSDDYYMMKQTEYKIHSTTLLPSISFERARDIPKSIDSSIFINAGESKLSFALTVLTQNYLLTKYLGRAPYEFYGPKTQMGTEFQLICKDGDPSKSERYFATRDAIR